MVLDLDQEETNFSRAVRHFPPEQDFDKTTKSFIDLSHFGEKKVAVVSMSLIAAMLLVNAANDASAQTIGALEPQPQAATKPMTPQRLAWLKGRCSQLVAYYDYYGVSRGENSDGARNHARIGAVVECSETNYRTGIDTMAALLKRKAFVVPKPGTPSIEPEDDGAPVADVMRRSSF